MERQNVLLDILHIFVPVDYAYYTHSELDYWTLNGIGVLPQSKAQRKAYEEKQMITITTVPVKLPQASRSKAAIAALLENPGMDPKMTLPKVIKTNMSIPTTTHAPYCILLDNKFGNDFKSKKRNVILPPDTVVSMRLDAVDWTWLIALIDEDKRASYDLSMIQSASGYVRLQILCQILGIGILYKNVTIKSDINFSYQVAGCVDIGLVKHTDHHGGYRYKMRYERICSSVEDDTCTTLDQFAMDVYEGIVNQIKTHKTYPIVYGGKSTIYSTTFENLVVIDKDKPFTVDRFFNEKTMIKSISETKGTASAKRTTTSTFTPVEGVNIDDLTKAANKILSAEETAEIVKEYRYGVNRKEMNNYISVEESKETTRLTIGLKEFIYLNAETRVVERKHDIKT